MNSKQRRARIRAGMPGVMHRILTMKLMDDIPVATADAYLELLRGNNLSFITFEKIVRGTASFERQAERRAALKDYVASTGRTVVKTFPSFQPMPRTTGANPYLGARYSGKSAHFIVTDEITQIK